MKYLILQTILIIAASITAQQSIDLPHNYDNQFINNAGATALHGGTEVSGYYNRSFNNVDNAPTTFMAGLQYELPEQSASIGGYLISEKASLLSQNTIAGTFAYKLRGIGEGYISMGIGMNLSMYSFDGNDALVIHQADPNLGNNESGMGINFQAGAVYSTAEKVGGRNGSPIMVQLGVGAARLNRGINIKSLYQYNEEMLITGFASLLYSQGKELVFRAFVESQYEAFSQLNLNLGGRAVINETFLAGASIDNDLNLGVQLGIMLATAGSDAMSTLAFNFNLPMGDIVSYTNPGIGITLHHQIETASGW